MVRGPQSSLGKLAAAEALAELALHMDPNVPPGLAANQHDELRHQLLGAASLPRDILAMLEKAIGNYLAHERAVDPSSSQAEHQDSWQDRPELESSQAATQPEDIPDSQYDGLAQLEHDTCTLRGQP